MQTSKKVNSVLKGVLNESHPSEEEVNTVKDNLEEFLKKTRKKIKNLGIDTEVFVGGSFAKETMIKKDKYDADIFLRFDKKHKKEMSELTYKILKGFKSVSVIHGSRDYFRIEINKNLFFEVIPVIKIKNPKDADNITDLSFFHVGYIRKKLKGKILDEVILAKRFCYANGCYGAESYIKGFSGYALELLIYHYKSFLRFIKEMAKTEERIIIDTEKQYKNKQGVMMDLNSSKLKSPIVLIDPTFKKRNALAALSKETFEKFRKVCRDFLKNPGREAFDVRKINYEEIKKNAEHKKSEFILLEAETDKQEGDIAGSKLLKFYNHLTEELKDFFCIIEKGFEYSGKNSAKFFMVVKRKKEILHHGPRIKDKENVQKFRKKHKRTFVKSGKVYSKEKINFKVKEFIRNWENKNREKIRAMEIKSLGIVK